MWIYKNEKLTAIPDDAVGFVYLITRTNIDINAEEPMYYIGKKHFYSKRKQKGSKRRKTIESDWRNYYGSSSYLKESIQKNGKDNFYREIIRICYSKSEMTYHEVMEQVNRKVLKYDKSSVMPKKYYNLNILGKFYKDTLFTNADKVRIKEYIESSNHDQMRIFVTDGIDTKCLNALIEDIPQWLSQNPNWHLGSTIHNTNDGKIWVTNDTISKPILPTDLDDFLNDNPTWRKGFQATENYCIVTNGDDNLHILCDTVDEFISKNNDWYRGSNIKGKCLTVSNGEQNRRIKKEQVSEFLADNNTWRLGAKCIKEKVNYISMIHLTKFKQMMLPDEHVSEYKDNGWEEAHGRAISHYFKWITKNKNNKKVNPNDLDKYIKDGWQQGRYNNYNKGNATMFKDGEYKSVKSSDIDQYLDDAWILKGKSLGNRVNIHNGTTQRWFNTLEKANEFINNNKGYVLGQLTREKLTTNNVVPCVNLVTNKKEMVECNMYHTNKYKKYISVKEFNNGQYVVIFNNQMFIGYRSELIFKYDFPPSIFRLAKDEKYHGTRGKNTKFNGLVCYKKVK